MLMGRKKVETWDLESRLLYQEWSLKRIAKHYKLTERAVRDKLKDALRDKEAELMELEGDVEAIKEALAK